MASFQEIREGIATNLASIAGLQESAYLLGNPTLPAAHVAPERIDYDQTFRRGLDKLRFRVTVLVGSASDIGSQKKLDSFIAPSGALSIKAALESDDVLGGDAHGLRVTECSGYRLFKQDGGTVALGADWTVEVYAEGTA